MSTRQRSWSIFATAYRRWKHLQKTKKYDSCKEDIGAFRAPQSPLTLLPNSFEFTLRVHLVKYITIQLKTMTGTTLQSPPHHHSVLFPQVIRSPSSTGTFWTNTVPHTARKTQAGGGGYGRSRKHKFHKEKKEVVLYGKPWPWTWQCPLPAPMGFACHMCTQIKIKVPPALSSHFISNKRAIGGKTLSLSQSLTLSLSLPLSSNYFDPN